MDLSSWKDIKIGIVGGQGQMGVWFKQRFENLGIEVLVTDRGTALSAKDLAEKCPVVIVAVPIVVTTEVIAEIGPHMPETSLLMDLTSNKSDQVKAMLEASSCEVLGAHPLFGPREESIEGRRIVFCPARGEVWFEKMKNLFEHMGAIIRVTTPEHHDRLMASVQGLSHLTTLALALAIESTGLDIQDLDDYGTTSFAHLRQQIARTLRQDTDLISAIITTNPEVGPAIDLLEAHIRAIQNMIKQKDMSGCAALMRQAREYLNVEPDSSKP